MLGAFDESVLLFIQNNLRFALLDPLMIAASRLGDAGMIWIAVGILMLFFKKTRRSGVYLLACLAFASMVNNLLIKNLVARPRPYTALEELILLIDPLTSFSFPSGHACSSFASATALAKTLRRGWLAFIPAFLIAFSRTYVGVHYATDVLFGALVGAGCSLLLLWLSKKYLKTAKPEKN